MTLLEQEYTLTYGGVILLAVLWIIGLAVQKWTGKPIQNKLELVKTLADVFTVNVNNTILKWWVVLKPNEKIPDFLNDQPSPLQSQISEISVAINSMRDEFMLMFSSITATIKQYHPDPEDSGITLTDEDIK